eukprot:scaffold222648_cov35-Tisochrysis_lutea.AAC.1
MRFVRSDAHVDHQCGHQHRGFDSVPEVLREIDTKGLDPSFEDDWKPAIIMQVMTSLAEHQDRLSHRVGGRAEADQADAADYESRQQLFTRTDT